MARTKESLEQRFYKIIESLFRELDQKSIMAEVEALQEKKPGTSREQLAKELIKRTAKKTALVGATAGIPGGPFGLLAAAPDIFNLVRSQSRLVLSIAFLYDQKPGLEERFKEVLAVLALSTGASATRQGVRYLITRGLTGKTAESIMKKMAGRFMARKIPSIAPIVGSIAGAGLNYMAVQATGKIAIEYYSSELDRNARSSASAPVSSARKTASKRTSKSSRKSKKSAGARKSSATTRKPAGSKRKASSKKTSKSKRSSKKSSSKTGSSSGTAGKS